MLYFNKRIITLVFILTTVFVNAQNTGTKNDGGTTKNNSFNDFNSWSIGAGVSNMILHGDLRSLGTLSGKNYYNFGGYFYIDKMFNPVLGIEMKLNYFQVGGERLQFSQEQFYRVLYAERFKDRNLHVEGYAIGGETSMIVSLDNLWRHHSKKWNFSFYLGMGYHIYNSKLVINDYDSAENLTGVDPDGTITAANFGENKARNNTKFATSIYFNSGLGVKYRLNKKIDLEFRSTIYRNSEDHLDAAISLKERDELFFVTNIGVSYKFGKKSKYAIWVNEKNNEMESDPFELVDTDNDGVEDLFDKEPDTPEGAEVYGSGIAIDSDKDGLQDYKDKCPLEPGLIENQGCPIEKPKEEVIVEKEEVKKEDPIAINEAEKQSIIKQISLLSKAIYFKTASDQLKEESYKPLNEISAIMIKYPQSKYKIEGHTDSRGRDAYNLDLSKRRAKSVKNYLTEKGITGNRTSSQGYGEERPIKTNDTEEGRQFNRRVEINFIDPDSAEGRLVYDKGVSFTEEVVISGDSINNLSSQLIALDMSKLSNVIVDTDGDGVADVYDKEPNTPIVSKVYGNGVSVDSDADGTPDYRDDCPFLIGPKEQKGCPSDVEAAMKTISNGAKVSLKKADSDGDGVADVYDKEPNTPPNVKVYSNGVSFDSDKDGVPDHKDRCPLIKGLTSNDGCPTEEDLDGDGVPDSKDYCPDEKGEISNNGCPARKATNSIHAQLNQLASKIKFSRSEGHILKSNNIAILGQIGDVMNDYKATSFIIEVHTNNKPNLKYNLDLSKRRAFAIKKYLTKSKNISSDRIEVIGLGGTKMKYDSSTPAENAKNNRVEIKYN